jgi:hypothetical protein
VSYSAIKRVIAIYGKDRSALPLYPKLDFVSYPDENGLAGDFGRLPLTVDGCR